MVVGEQYFPTSFAQLKKYLSLLRWSINEIGATGGLWETKTKFVVETKHYEI